MEIRKLLFVFAAIAAAAFSPAPVPEVVSGTKPVVEQSQAQVAKQQTVNGTVPVVGTVPDRVNEVGHVVDEKAPSQTHKSGENAVALGSSRLEGGSNVVAAASARVEAGEKTKRIAWWIGAVVLVLGYLGGRAIVKKVEKETPVPTFSKTFLKKIENGKI